MVLNELHVLQRSARAIGQRHAIAGLDGGVGGEAEHAAAAARAQDDGLGGDRLNLSGGQLDRDHALHAAVVDQQFGDKELVVAGDGVVLERRLKERVEHVEAGLVGGKPRARLSSFRRKAARRRVRRARGSRDSPNAPGASAPAEPP